MTEHLKSLHPHIPWASIIGLRNRAAHGYHSLYPDIIWDIVSGELSALEEVVRRELQS